MDKHDRPVPAEEEEPANPLGPLVRDLVDLLPEQERLVIEKVYFEGCKAGEIADELGIASSDVYRLQRQARARLKEMLDARQESPSGSSSA